MRHLFWVSLTTLLCFGIMACAESAKSENPSASKLTPPSQNQDAGAKPFFVGITDGDGFVTGWMKDLSLSEEQFSVCWSHRDLGGPNWAVVQWQWQSEQKAWQVDTSGAKGEPAALVKCLTKTFASWLKQRKQKGNLSGRFYLVEDQAQLGKTGWPQGGGRYQWQGVRVSRKKNMRIYQ